MKLRLALITLPFLALPGIAAAQQWTGSANLNVNVVQSTQNTTAVIFLADAKRAFAKGALSTRFIYSFQKATATTQDRASAFGQYDFVINKNSFAYASLGFDRDKISFLTLRTQVGAGYGIYIHNDEKLEAPGQWRWSVDAGLAYIKEQYSVGANSSRTAGRIGTNYARVLGKGLKFNADVQFTPALQGKRYLVNADLRLVADIGKSWQATLGYLLLLNSQPAPGSARNTTTYVLAIGYKF